MTNEDVLVALLRYLDAELSRVMWNITQEEFDSPFDNTGACFKNDVFEVRAYYWGDDEALEKLPNFRCEDVEVSWYKYLGRGMSVNKPLSVERMVEVFDKCLISIRGMDV